MADSDFFLGEYSVISEILSRLQISKLIRSQISYAIHDFVTADYEIIVVALYHTSTYILTYG